MIFKDISTVQIKPCFTCVVFKNQFFPFLLLRWAGRELYIGLLTFDEGYTVSGGGEVFCFLINAFCASISDLLGL